LPDNLRLTSSGKLLLAGQLTSPETLFDCGARGEPCALAFEVVAVDPDTLALEPKARADEEQAEAWGFGGATGALEVDGELWVGSFTGERIGKFRLAA
jgi:hypothetical protein